MELRRQFRNGIFGQINYTFSKTTSDSIGNASQNRIEPFLDNARPELDAGYSIYHNAHVINANGVFELPFGEGKRWLNGGFNDAIFGGWQLATIVKWQSRRAAGVLRHARHVQPHRPFRAPDRGDLALKRPDQGALRRPRNVGRSNLLHRSGGRQQRRPVGGG